MSQNKCLTKTTKIINISFVLVTYLCFSFVCLGFNKSFLLHRIPLGWLRPSLWNLHWQWLQFCTSLPNSWHALYLSTLENLLWFSSTFFSTHVLSLPEADHHRFCFLLIPFNSKESICPKSGPSTHHRNLLFKKSSCESPHRFCWTRLLLPCFLRKYHQHPWRGRPSCHLLRPRLFHLASDEIDRLFCNSIWGMAHYQSEGAKSNQTCRSQSSSRECQSRLMNRI